jgi:hypothetical protein
MTAIVTTDPTAVIVVAEPARRQFTMMSMATAAHAAVSAGAASLGDRVSQKKAARVAAGHQVSGVEGRR